MIKVYGWLLIVLLGLMAALSSALIATIQREWHKIRHREAAVGGIIVAVVSTLFLAFIVVKLLPSLLD